MTGNVYPAGFVANEKMRAAQADLNRRYNDMADAMLCSLENSGAFTYSWYQLPWYQKAWYHAKLPWWALQAWICHHICDCD